MVRRGENIYRRKDGRYEGRYIKGYKRDRTPIYGSIYSRKYRDCKEKLMKAKVLSLYKKPPLKVCGKGTLIEFLDYWFHHIIKPMVKPSTAANYMVNIRNWIEPILGDSQLDQIDAEDIQQFINFLAEENLSPGTIRNIYHVLKGAMKKAKGYGYIMFNPCNEIILPKVKSKPSQLLTINEQKKLERMAKKVKHGAPIMLALYTGMRIGEICALKWGDIDLENAILTVSKTRQRISATGIVEDEGTQLVTNSAKSIQSERIIPLPSCMKELLKRQKKQAYGQFVFCNEGVPLEPRILQYSFQRLRKKQTSKK